jgi:hypothetical protein
VLAWRQQTGRIRAASILTARNHGAGSSRGTGRDVAAHPKGIKMRKAHHDTIRVPGAAGAVSLATAQCTLPYRYAGEEDFFPFLIIFLNLIRFSQISLFDMTYVAVTPVFIFSYTNLFDMTYIAVV